MKPTPGSRANPLLILPISQKNIVFTVPSCHGSPSHRSSLTPASANVGVSSGGVSREDRGSGEAKLSPGGLLATCAQSSFLAPFTAPFISPPAPSSPASSPLIQSSNGSSVAPAISTSPNTSPYNSQSLSPSPNHHHQHHLQSRHQQQRRYSDIGGLTSSHAHSMSRAVAGAASLIPGSAANTGPTGEGRESPKHRASFSSVTTSHHTSASTQLSPYRVPGFSTTSLGTLDPSLYTHRGEIGRIDSDDEVSDVHYNPPQGHLGRVWFSLEYENETEKLLVTLVRARNLPCRSRTHANSCDPFARIFLMPDERRYLQSKPRKKTCDPKFGESYVFQVSARNLYERTLKITIYDIDRQRRHHVIGHAMCCFRDLRGDNTDVLSYERLTLWRDLEREVIEPSSDRGELETSMSYNSTVERLTIGILHGRHFKNLCSSSSSNQDYYVKLCLCQHSRVIKTKRTDLVRGSSDSPHFNESFTFKLSNSCMDTYSVNVIVMQYKAGLKDKQLGRVVLGSFMFARGRERDHWNTSVASPGEQFIYWHTLA